jgi:hypothetical protein
MTFEPSNATDYNFHLGCNKIFDFTEKNKQKLAVPLDWWNKDVTNAHNRWNNAWANCQDPDNKTKLITAEKNDARTAYQPLIAQTIDFLRGNALVTDAQQRKLDIFIAPRHTQPLPTTNKFPAVNVELNVIRRITGHIVVAGTDSKAKPDGVATIQFAWAIKNNDPNEKPVTIDELLHENLEIYTRSAFILEFDEDDRGKTVYMVARYGMSSSKSGFGPWGEITYAIVP